MGEQTPLITISPRDSDQQDDAHFRSPRSSSRLREIALLAWALAATAAVVVLAIVAQQSGGGNGTAPPASPAGKRNLVFMVSDGMGPASLSLTRSFRQHTAELPMDDVLTLDRHFWGTSRTRSSSSLVTDSAAGATAFSCGAKSYNGAISVLPDFTPCGTVMEAAKRAGYLTGLVVTTDITDATPACFASHVHLRSENDAIALQEIGDGVLGRSVDLMLGGGRCHFLPRSRAGGCRADDIDVTEIAQKKHGWTYTDSRAGFDSLGLGRNVTLPTLGLFASGDVPFEIDRRNMADVYPSLSEMAETALTALEEATKDSDKGFFLMIEGSRIDHAGHINDPAAQVREVLEYDKTFGLVLEHLAKSKTEGVLVATSDHETGGLATALQKPGELPVYDWHPLALARANASSEHVAKLLVERVTSKPGESKGELKQWIKSEILAGRLGITDPSDRELEELADDPGLALTLFSHMVSARARIGWSTHGHSAVDVNIYSSGGPGTDRIRGNVENTDVGKYLREYLGVDVDAITKELRSKMGKVASAATAAARDEAGVESHPLDWLQ